MSWNYTEFVTFLLIYAAHADIDFSSMEIDFIKEFGGEETFEKMYENFEELSEYQILEVLQSYKKIHYPDEPSKQKILETMLELFHIDGEYSSMEKTLTLFLNHLL